MDQEKLFTRDTALLVPLGILINILGAQAAAFLKLPLFLDSLGTILAGALGGYLPGIIVGFFSNVVNSLPDPITLYYGTLSILFGILAAFLSRRGVFCRLSSSLLSSLPFALIGGAMGSVITWMLYGLDFGSGISAVFAIPLYERLGIGKFYAQLIADFVIDVADKAIILWIVYLVLRRIPARFLRSIPLGGVYLKDQKKEEHTCLPQ